MFKFLFNPFFILPVLFYLHTVHYSTAQTKRTVPDELSLWYDRPASEWNEALPVGNGRFGAMVFGKTYKERLQLNEESVWVGKPADFVNPEARAALPKVRELLFAGKYDEAQKLAKQKMMGNKKIESTYQTLGDLLLEFDSTHNESSAYRRDLDLETAIAGVKYKIGNTEFSREIFSSAADQVIVIRLTADKPGALNFLAKLSRPGDNAKVEVSRREIHMREHIGGGVGVNIIVVAKILNEGGNVQQKANGLKVENANSVTILLTAATDYNKKDPDAVSKQQLSSAEVKKYEELKSRHIAEYQQYFKRVSLNLGTTDAVYFPTDARLQAMQKGSTDPQLVRLYFQYGRYLLISSSRPGGLPANLQGIWADGLNPPWSADYHININIQMNYWPAEVTNLSEMHMPFLTFLDRLRPDARKTAKDMYGVKGTVAHFTTDPWYFTEPYGEPQWAMWPMGMAWGAQHLWEHYLFTEDKDYLNNLGYPVMKEAAEFVSNFLVEHPQSKKLVSGPSISPENTFRAPSGEIATMVMGPTMDHMIIRELLNNTIAASKVLKTDAAFRRRMEKILDELAPIEIGSDGRIMEWSEEFEEPEPGHRHISHLFALHPGHQINQQHPELMEAARKTIDHRLRHGGGHTGWSRAWIINFFARLHNEEAAYQNLLALLRKSTLPNLFDTHPPFQIDGNFGATAGITEMLMQSHTGEVELLPALPAEAWPQGFIHGIVARGGFEVDIDWEKGRLKGVKVLSRLGNPLKIRYGNKLVSIETKKGQEYHFNGELKQL